MTIETDHHRVLAYLQRRGDVFHRSRRRPDRRASSRVGERCGNGRLSRGLGAGVRAWPAWRRPDACQRDSRRWASAAVHRRRLGGQVIPAAAFSTLGHTVLADDIVRIDIGDREVSPIRVIRGWASRRFGGGALRRARATSWRSLRIPEASPRPSGGWLSFRRQTSTRLRRFMCSESDLRDTFAPPSNEPVPPSAALVALVRHTYGGCLSRSRRCAPSSSTSCAGSSIACP